MRTGLGVTSGKHQERQVVDDQDQACVEIAALGGEHDVIGRTHRAPQVRNVMADERSTADAAN